MSSLNKHTIIGNLGADPEIKHFQNGGKLANLRIATTEKWKDKNTGERKEETVWHNVVVLNESIITNVIEKYVKKGDKVYIEGKIKHRVWQDRDGNDRYSTETVLSGYDGNIVLL